MFQHANLLQVLLRRFAFRSVAAVERDAFLPESGRYWRVLSAAGATIATRVVKPVECSG